MAMQKICETGNTEVTWQSSVSDEGPSTSLSVSCCHRRYGDGGGGS